MPVNTEIFLFVALRKKTRAQITLLWRVGGHGGIDGDQGTFWVHHHNGSVPTQRRQEDFFGVAHEHLTSTLTLRWCRPRLLAMLFLDQGAFSFLFFPPSLPNQS